MKTRISIALLTLSLAVLHNAAAQGTAFTYQGRLIANGVAANGNYDLQFHLRDADVAGNVIGTTNSVSAVAVNNGLFTVLLDFGANSFTGAERWLEIGVRTNGGGSYVILTPRQLVAAAPFAVTAINLASVVAFNTNSGGRATLAGGFLNISSGFEATVGGGRQNRASGGQSTVAGGSFNTSSGSEATVGGGTQNTASGDHATVPGGQWNTASGHHSFAAGWRARANHDGTFVWADSTGVIGTDFASTGPNQFLVRASGGVGLGTTNPAAKLHLYSTDNPTTFRIQSAGAPGAARIEFLSDPQGSGSEWRPGYIQSTDNGGFTGGLAFFVNGSGGANRFGDVEVMRVVNGRVGIGTNNPQAALELLGGGLPGPFMPVIQATSTNLKGSALRAIHTAGGDAIVAQTVGSGSAIQASNQDPAGKAGFFIGNVSVAPPGVLSFDAQTRQMLNLWGTQYGIGVQSSTIYFRVANNSSPNDGFIWYRGGVHNDNYANPGGGTEMMHLVPSGLYVNGALVPVSDRNAKENFEPVNSREVLEKVAALPLSKWNYKTDTSTRHVGPMAQDFYAAFGVGPDDKHIATVDADGVALAAIQGLNQKLTEELKRRDAENAELRREVEKLKQVVNDALTRR